MKHITKHQSPAFFEDWKDQCPRCRDDLENIEQSPMVKRNLKRSLLNEQGHICCYCQKRIDENNSVIEHLKCRDGYPESALDYHNLLASCLGGQTDREGKSRREKRTIPIYCDAIKDNSDIYISPLDEDCEMRFAYGAEGEIFCDDADTDAMETIRVLNLDCSTLRNLRKAAINAYQDEHKRFPGKEQIPDIIKKLLQRKSDGRFDEFCVVVAGFLKNLP